VAVGSSRWTPSISHGSGSGPDREHCLVEGHGATWLGCFCMVLWTDGSHALCVHDTWRVWWCGSPQERSSRCDAVSRPHVGGPHHPRCVWHPHRPRLEGSGHACAYPAGPAPCAVALQVPSHRVNPTSSRRNAAAATPLRPPPSVGSE
jgi:hypothetical protein